MPCSSIATVAIALDVATLAELRSDRDALEALETALTQILAQPKLQVVVGADRPPTVYFATTTGVQRYLQLTQDGATLNGAFTLAERDAISKFLQQLPSALAEQRLVVALGAQFQLIEDEAVYDQQGVASARQLVIRV